MRVYLFDADVRDREGRESQMRLAGATGEHEVRATSSRNELLAAIGHDATTASRNSIALIDFKTNAEDLEQIGFRIVETIRRHRDLCRACRPLIWIDYVTQDNVDEAKRVQADAVIADSWIDQNDGRPLVEILREARTWKPHSHRPQAAEPRVYAEDPVENDSLSKAQIDARFVRRFGFKPHDLHYKILWGMADAIELSFLHAYCAEKKWAPNERAARRACIKMTEAMRDDRDALDAAPPSHSFIARQFIATSLPCQPSPLSELSWPATGGTRKLIENDEVRGLAFLEPGVDRELDFFLAWVPEELDHGRPKTADRFRAIDDAVERCAEQFSRDKSTMRDRLQRAAHALDDAYEDLRHHGPPSAEFWG